MKLRVGLDLTNLLDLVPDISQGHFEDQDKSLFER